MKINEIVNSSIMKQGWKKQDHRDGLDLKAMANEEGLSILAYDAGGREIGFVHFEIIDDKLESFDTWVDPRMRRQGIATVMYNYAKELGNDLAPSTAQTPDGKKFWKSIKQQPVAEGGHKLDNVVTDLEQDLENPHSYDAIDHMMQTIAREHDITAKQLHDMFVAKHGQVPDEWVNDLAENFADGKNPQDKGDSKRHGIKDADAQQVLNYIHDTHHEPLTTQLQQAVLSYPRWELRSVPLSSLHIPDQEYDDEEQEPEADLYNRVQAIDPDHAGEYSANFVDRRPIVVDADGWIIDGNHRAWAASELLNRSTIRAWVPTSIVDENFADGRNPQDKGDSKRHGIPKHATLAQLDKIAHQGGRRGQLAHWQANMRRGRK